MKPCDCPDEYSCKTYLNEQGLGFGDCEIGVHPPSVLLTVGPCRIRIPQAKFRAFAEWYLEDQVKDE